MRTDEKVDQWTWQVRRSEFDKMLLDEAIERGAGLLEGRASEPIVDDTGHLVGVTVRTSAGSTVRVEAAHTIPNYSFQVRKFAGPGYICVGDAHRFVDPIFSFGLYVAIKGRDEAVAAFRNLLERERVYDEEGLYSVPIGSRYHEERAPLWNSALDSVEPTETWIREMVAT
jgi:flavin-dependent dehydrogenase